MARPKSWKSTAILALVALFVCHSAIGKAQHQRPGGRTAATGQRPVWPAYEKVESQLQEWQRKHSAVMKLDVVTKSIEGRSVYALRLTDSAVADAHKQHVLLTALHTGRERSGGTGLLRVVQWLLSQDRVAREVLKRQVVVVVPIINPDGYVGGYCSNARGKDIYAGWSADGPPSAPADGPEAAALKKLMDLYQPEVHSDYHGISLDFPDWVVAVENSGSSYGNAALRPYHRDIMRLMDEAAEAGGFPSDTLEDDAELLTWGPRLEAIRDKLWIGRPMFHAAVYCYNRYHSLVLASEVGWDESTLLRSRRLLQIGNETWPGEYYAGYPTRVISKGAATDMLAAYGDTAAARRRSRVELWNKRQQIVHGHDAPNFEGAGLYVCATSPSASTRFLADNSLAGVARAIQGRAEIDSQPILRLVKRYPEKSGQWGPRPQFRLTGGGAKQHAPIEHGLAIRLRIPYPKARVTDLRLNGWPIRRSETDGYVTWVARAYTYVQVNIPPETSKRQDFFLVTWEYDPGENRVLGWTGSGE